VDQRALSQLAEELAPLAALGTTEAAAQIGARIRAEAVRHRVAPWTLTSMVGGEWVRSGAVSPSGDLTRPLQ
jgi:hypothetical protein